MADHEPSTSRVTSNNNLGGCPPPNNNSSTTTTTSTEKEAVESMASIVSDGGPATVVDPAIDAKERLQRFDLVIQHLHRLRATLALDSSVREFQKIHTLTLLGQLPNVIGVPPNSTPSAPPPPPGHHSPTTNRPPPLNHNGGLLPPLPPPPPHILGMRPPPVGVQQPQSGGLMPPAQLPLMGTKHPMGR